ncbi:hypothetical protein GGI25_006478, partial [Coemansia spiralis]
MSNNSNLHQTSPIVNSSAIAELSPSSKDVRDSPINHILQIMRRSAPNDKSPSEKVANCVISSISSSSHPCNISEYKYILDIVRAYIDTNRGKQGSKIQITQFRELLCALIESRDCFDIAAVAFFATVHRNTLDPHIQHQLEEAIQQRTQDSGVYDESALRLDEVYSKFLTDAERCKPEPKKVEISVLDIRRFAYKWLYRSNHYCPSFAFHWDVNNMDCLPEDALSEPFLVYGIKCKLRFCKKITLSNGETWTGMWLHNVSSGFKVLDVKFALVVSNLAYPTIHHVQVIDPAAGIRPSQGIGVKLFALLGDLTRCVDGNTLPIIESNS